MLRPISTTLRLAALLSLLAAPTLLARNLQHRPETWFHFIGGNVSSNGITADLEAIASAGYSGVQFFHGSGDLWPGTQHPVVCLGPEWLDMVRHLRNECTRLGLRFVVQNCPGWSLAGGPWIPHGKAMRNLVANDPSGLDYRDILTVAFPEPLGDRAPETILPPPDYRHTFPEPVCIRTLELPNANQCSHPHCYTPQTDAELYVDGRLVRTIAIPSCNWQGEKPFVVALPETTGTVWQVRFKARHGDLNPNLRVAIRQAARQQNWCGEGGFDLINAPEQILPAQDPRSWVSQVLVCTNGTTPPIGWKVLRIGHINAGHINAPAPKEATGWECDKLAPVGAETHFAGYVGHLIQNGIRPDGMLIDSWECHRQSWTDNLDLFQHFRARRGYDLAPWMPALFGYIVKTPQATRDFLRDWRTLLDELVSENFFGRLSQLAKREGLFFTYETAFGDILPGDILRYYRHADVPMCEFWQSQTDPTPHFVYALDFKPVRPTVSAAHLYGKPRVAAEAFTSFDLTFNESLDWFRAIANQYYARGITHLVTHTYTHQPTTNGLLPGTSFGNGIGAPFLKGQTWWRHFKAFTDWAERCERWLEWGEPVVDVLYFLGDAHVGKPEVDGLPEGVLFDYCNAEGLARLGVEDGKLRTPEGATYGHLFLPEGVRIGAASGAEIARLERAGASVWRGKAGACKPALEASAPLLYCHRRKGSEDCFFVTPPLGCGFEGRVVLNGVEGKPCFYDPVSGKWEAGNLSKFSLAMNQSLFIVCRKGGYRRLPPPVLPREEVPGPWVVRVPGFEPVRVPRLASLTELPLPREARCHAGDVVYETVFDGPAVGLDLGRVCGVAEVEIDGFSQGIRWCTPYRWRLHLAEGKHQVRVRVTTTWRNRLIYEAGLPESERRSWTIAGPKADAPLVPAGLIGPVRIAR
ncbi:MAG: glycosyl hydrolase [Kiritimatiellia bacterium]